MMVFLPKMSHVFGGGTHAHRSLATELKVQKQWGGFMLISPSLSVRPLCCTNSNRSIIFLAINILDHGHRCLDSGMHGVRVSWPQMMDLVWMHHHCHFDGPLDIVYFLDSGWLLFPFLLRRLVVLCHCVLHNPELELKICSNATIYFETSMLSPMDLCSISSDLQCSGSFCRTSNVEVAKCIESERCGNSSVTTSGSLPHLQVGFRCPFRSLRLVEAHRGGQGIGSNLTHLGKVQGNNNVYSKLGQKELIYRNFQGMLKRASRRAQKPCPSNPSWFLRHLPAFKPQASPPMQWAAQTNWFGQGIAWSSGISWESMFSIHL